MLTRKRSRPVLIAALTLALLAGFAKPSSAFLDKTRFVAHLGVAYFCFHHWVIKPYQEGGFNDGAPHRVATIVKGGAALLFAYHEVKVSEKIAHDSNSPILHALDTKLIALGASMATVGASLKSGHFNPADIQGLSALTGSVKSDAAAAGEDIKDVPVPDVKIGSGT
jgi:hypothetical protein